MIWDMATARARIGLTAGDTSQDILLTAGMDAALAIAEQYCDRRFTLQVDTEVEVHPVGRCISLRRYPIVSVASIRMDSARGTQPPRPDAVADTWHIDGERGQIVFDGAVPWHTVSIEYTGGYSTLPPGLVVALWRIFDLLWPEVSGTSAAPAAAQAIDSITIADVGTIRWGSGATAAMIARADASDTWAAFRPGINLLDPWRRYNA